MPDFTGKDWKESIVKLESLSEKYARQAEERQLRWKAEREAHLKSPEYAAIIRQEEEQKIAYDKLKAEKEAWALESKRIQKNPPKVGVILHGNIRIILTRDEKDQPSYQARLQFYCSSFPVKSYWNFSNEKYGMICFLTRRSCAEVDSKLTFEFQPTIRVKAVRIMAYSANGRSATIQVEEW